MVNSINSEPLIISSTLKTTTQTDTKYLSVFDYDRIIEMAWEDRTPFEAIRFQFGLNESAVIGVMRDKLAFSSFKMWRKRMRNRNTKHLALRTKEVLAFKCSRQRNTGNKITKR
jgi:uncharacterized protein (TIGR03643 family)